MFRNASTRAIAGASIGNFGEIYDFAIFGFSVPVLADHFFPKADPRAAILSTLLVYAAAFLARPLGGLIFGPLADRIGRVKVLAATIWLMAAGTAAIGLLPTYAQIGILAPVLLVCCRIAQGLAMGGETTGSTSFILESAPAGARGRWVGTIWFFALLPNAVAALGLAGLRSAVGDQAYDAWVWRLPFLAGGLIGVIGFWLRRRLDESEEFKRSASNTPEANPLRKVAHSGLRPILYVFIIQPVQTVSSYLLHGFMYTFLVKEANLAPTAALVSNAVAVVVLAIMIPIGGVLSDRLGRKPILRIGAAWLAAVAYPAVMLAATGTLTGAILGQVLLALGIGLYGGASFAAAAEYFPTAYRATGHAIAYQVAVALFGGGTPYVATWLVHTFSSPQAPSSYVFLVALVSVFAIRFVPETRGMSLRSAAGSMTEDVPVSMAGPVNRLKRAGSEIN